MLSESFNRFMQIVHGGRVVTEVQRVECNKAFMAGCKVMFESMMACMEHEDDAVCEKNLDALQKNLEAEINKIIKSEIPTH